MTYDTCSYEDETHIKKVEIDAVRAERVAGGGYAGLLLLLLLGGRGYAGLLLFQPLCDYFPSSHPFVSGLPSLPCLLHQLVQAGQGGLEAWGTRIRISFIPVIFGNHTTEFDRIITKAVTSKPDVSDMERVAVRFSTFLVYHNGIEYHYNLIKAKVIERQCLSTTLKYDH